LVKEKLQAGEDPMAIIHECNAGMAEVGRRFETNEFFISELIMSGEILRGAMTYLTPYLGDTTEASTKGTVVIGTVKDDIHDIGKNIVTNLLKSTGYDVMDLGVDVEAKNFVNAVRETGAKVLGLSALLNLTYPRMKEVVEALKEAGIRDQVTVVIGGAPCNEEVRQAVGADYYATDAAKGLRICDEIYGK
ncbi:MAG: cobalamin-dependent protein, partial [Deltaproteobacteria bacterium]|nr:cobalamin-dependent protein [Deltaproteobacteria bacterium]MBW2138749.1 cobalamin-dependent protein [Deltaproteobacteria bacterium]